jgi:hypothetical protein
MFHGLKGFSKMKSILVFFGISLGLSQAVYGHSQIPFGFFKASAPPLIFGDGFESGFTSGVPNGWTRVRRNVNQDTVNFSEGASAVSLSYSVDDEGHGEISRAIDFTGVGTVSLVLTAIQNTSPCFSHLIVKVDGTTIIDSGGTGGPSTYTAAVSYSGTHTLAITMTASNTCSGTMFDDLRLY